MNQVISEYAQQLSFSQANGYENLPQQLALEELPKNARTAIWNCFYESMQESVVVYSYGKPWGDVLKSVHSEFLRHPLHQWSDISSRNDEMIRSCIFRNAFNRVFDLVQFVMRHESCPPEFSVQITNTFEKAHLAYSIVTYGSLPKIVPITTEAEKLNLTITFDQLDQAGFGPARAHLESAMDHMSREEWADSIEDSVAALESVGSTLQSNRSKKSFAETIHSLNLHRALSEGIIKLYGYASNEEGIRHANVSSETSKASMSEAVLMLGLCASLASFMARERAKSS